MAGFNVLISVFFFRQEALRNAERERRKKYKAQNDEREVVRSAIRDKVSFEYQKKLQYLSHSTVSKLNLYIHFLWLLLQKIENEINHK